jgi:hypothetical protein
MLIHGHIFDDDATYAVKVIRYQTIDSHDLLVRATHLNDDDACTDDVDAVVMCSQESSRDMECAGDSCVDVYEDDVNYNYWDAQR